MSKKFLRTAVKVASIAAMAIPVVGPMIGLSMLATAPLPTRPDNVIRAREK